MHEFGGPDPAPLWSALIPYRPRRRQPKLPVDTPDRALSLPRAGGRIIGWFTETEDHEHGMMVRHESLEILSRAAQNMRCNAGLEALLLICESNVDHRELADAATKVVQLAERWGLPQAVKRLEKAMDAAGAKPFSQAKLARALLRVGDALVAHKAFDILVSMAENESVEGWCRSMAAHALLETLDTPLEAQGVAAIIQYLCDVPSGVLNDEERRSLASDIISAARHHRSK